MKARELKKRNLNDLKMPLNHREVKGDEQLEYGDYIYLYFDKKWQFSEHISGWAGRTPNELNGNMGMERRFSTLK